MSFGLTRDVILVLLFAIEQLVPSFLSSRASIQGNRLFSFLLDNFDAFDFMRQANTHENSMLARD